MYNEEAMHYLPFDENILERKPFFLSCYIKEIKCAKIESIIIITVTQKFYAKEHKIILIID